MRGGGWEPEVGTCDKDPDTEAASLTGTEDACEGDEPKAAEYDRLLEDKEAAVLGAEFIPEESGSTLDGVEEEETEEEVREGLEAKQAPSPAAFTSVVVDNC